MADRGLSVLIASGPDRDPSLLAAMVERVARQLRPGDELIIDKNDDAPWGHKARNRMMAKANPTNGLVFYDDDDLPLSGGLDVIRTAFNTAPDDWHIFRMLYGATSLWRTPEVKLGNVSTQMVCVPQPMGLMTRWGNRYEGDYDFMESLQRTFGQPIFHEELVCHYNGLRERLG